VFFDLYGFSLTIGNLPYRASLRATLRSRSSLHRDRRLQYVSRLWATLASLCYADFAVFASLYISLLKFAVEPAVKRGDPSEPEDVLIPGLIGSLIAVAGLWCATAQREIIDRPGSLRGRPVESTGSRRASASRSSREEHS